MDLSRRGLLSGLAAASFIERAQAQNPNESVGGSPALPRFGYDDVIRRARELATAPFAPAPPLPEPLNNLDFDAWRDIRFRPDRALLAGPFKLQLFHLGHLFRQPVTVNTIRDGIATPVPYTASLFDFGRTRLEKPLPVNLGFAGFRLHYPLNDPRVSDELVAFLGASYFRFLGRGQRYGLSARAVTVGAGRDGEQFPFFREFWVETPEPNADRATIYALLDGEALTGAYRFHLWPGADTVLEVSVSLFARRANANIGLAPLTSMFLVGENDHRVHADYRSEMHDSDGLLMHTGGGEWIWRPLRNPARAEVSAFLDQDIRGFGLIQRDRVFDHYQDLDLNYEQRPSCWVEPLQNWGEGRIELAELPTGDETNDNIVASWVPRDAIEPGKPASFGYRVTASLDVSRLSPNGRVINTFQAQASALGARDPAPPGSNRFIVDFSGGDLPYFLNDPGLVEIVPSTSSGRILRSFLTPNPKIRGFRAVVDVQLDPGQSTDLRAFLRSGPRTLTETWLYPWKRD